MLIKGENRRFLPLYFEMITITPEGQVIAFISIALAIMSALVRKAVLDVKKLNRMKEEMKEQQKIMKEATKSGDTKKMQRAQEHLMKLTMENMKYSFKPMLITFIPFIIIFYWLQGQYSSIGTVATIFNFDLGWLGWYIVVSITLSIIINKLLNVS